MISNDEIVERFKATGLVSEVKVEGDGYHYHVTIISDVFQGKTKVARQQWVYAQVRDWITSGVLHALNMKTLTREEAEKEHG